MFALRKSYSGKAVHKVFASQGQEATLRVGGQQDPIPNGQTAATPSSHRKQHVTAGRHPEQAMIVRSHNDQPAALPDAELSTRSPSESLHDRVISDTPVRCHDTDAVNRGADTSLDELHQRQRSTHRACGLDSTWPSGSVLKRDRRNYGG
jgi:hypothetical protein